MHAWAGPGFANARPSLGSTIGLHDTIWVGAIMFFIPAIVLLLSPVRAPQVVPAQVDGEHAAAPA
jgi:hypothetical protein